jgi:hypothetical protein
MISRCLKELEFISHGTNMLNYFIGAEIAKGEFVVSPGSHYKLSSSSMLIILVFHLLLRMVQMVAELNLVISFLSLIHSQRLGTTHTSAPLIQLGGWPYTVSNSF